jgi:glycosyltransferase involved in cell wall biosynthesis
MSSINSNQQTLKKPLQILMVTGIYPTEKCPHSGTFIKSQVDSLIKKGLEIEIICPKPGPVLLRYASAAIQVFLKTLTKKFDIVHGHYGQWCLLARMQWTTPVVASFLGSDLLGNRDTNSNRLKLDTFIVSLSRWLSRHVDVATTKTEEMSKILSGGKVVVYPDGVDFRLFHPIPRREARITLEWNLDRYYILFGNNPKRSMKNYPLAKAAVEHLSKKGISAELVVATGLPQTTLVQYINASNAVILPSIYEGSPNIVKEAMACNVPVVATDVGDVAQIIGHTKGCSVCSHDVNALAVGLEQAIQHSEPTTGRADIALLESSKIASQIIAMYEGVLSKRRKKTFRIRKEEVLGNNPKSTDTIKELPHVY